MAFVLSLFFVHLLLLLPFVPREGCHFVIAALPGYLHLFVYLFIYLFIY